MTRGHDRIGVFRRLHQAGCFVIPNPRDLGSARLLVQLGFPALATPSSGFATEADAVAAGSGKTAVFNHVRFAI